MNFDNTSSILEPNESIIKTGLHIILTTDEDDLRPVYLSGILVYAGSEFVMEKIGSGLYHFKFTHDFDYPETLLYKFKKGIGVKWKLTATATVLKTDPQRNTQEYKKNMWDVGERIYHLSKTICHKSYLSLMNLKFLSLTELENMGVTSSRL
jgi:hypothetical protein